MSVWALFIENSSKYVSFFQECFIDVLKLYLLCDGLSYFVFLFQHDLFDYYVISLTK